MSKPVTINALFLGPKAGNYAFFKEVLNYLLDDHVDRRRCFHPDDAPIDEIHEIVRLREQYAARFCIVTPCLTGHATCEVCGGNFMRAMERAIERVWTCACAGTVEAYHAP